jgi:microcompartment protein CcmK/EutM
LIDRALDAVGDDLGEGLAAIDQSFGVLAGEGALVSRGPDARSAYLGRMVDG